MQIPSEITSKVSNFYPITNKLGTQVGLVKMQMELQDVLCESHRDT